MTYSVTLRLEHSIDVEEPINEDDAREIAIDMFLDRIQMDSDLIVREDIQFVRMEQD